MLSIVNALKVLHLYSSLAYGVSTFSLLSLSVEIGVEEHKAAVPR